MAGDPEKVGRYQVIERVGRGGMGVLYRGMDPVLDREVAIKLMLVDFSEDEEHMRPRFYREARAVAKLQHRNIVTVFEFAEEGTTPYIVMEFLRGESLAARMKSPLPLSLDAKLDIVAQLCIALDYAHQQGVVHRDVKPANVFVLHDSTVKLLDFGIAKVSTSTLTRQGDVLGSASYMSPEQVVGSDAVDGRSDIFSAGVLLYELLSGRKPFQSDAPTGIIMKIMHEAPPPIQDFVPGLPPALIAAINKALAKKPEERFATAGEFAAELQRIRRALEASGGAVEGLDETRFASPTEVRAYERDAAGARAEGEGTSAKTAPAEKKSMVVPAVIAAVVIVAVGIGYVVLKPGSSAATDAPTPASTSAAQGAGKATPSSPAATTSGGSAVQDKKGAPAAAGSAARHVLVSIESDPAGAAISVDGKDTKLVTPASVSIAGEGTHRLHLSKRGFAAQDVQVSDADLRGGTLKYSLKAEAVATVAVAITSTYPVMVTDGTKTLSAAAEAHTLNLVPGATVHIVSADYFLDSPLRIEDKAMDYQAPALGYLTVLTKYETCKVKIGAKDLGFPPITKLPLVSGQHRVDISCTNGQNPPGQFVTVAPNATATARIY